MLDAIRQLIEWVANDAGHTVATLLPFGLLGLTGLYFAWLVLGWLRVSQVGIETVQAPALRLPRAPDGALEAPRGVPYCPVDGLQYPAAARFCSVCESDLLVSCANCGTRIRAADESCYRCGTRDTTVAPAA
jgi:hypothetical protein